MILTIQHKLINIEYSKYTHILYKLNKLDIILISNITEKVNNKNY